MIGFKVNIYVKAQKIIILNHEIDKYIKQYYNKLLKGHPKITATIKIFQKNCYFFKMKHYITKYITQCMQC